MRRPLLRGAAAGLAAAVLLVARLDGQGAPRRPRLGSDADTNDAASYYQWGTERLDRDPDAAAAAFYWAARLDPLSAPVWDAQYVAQLLHDPGRLVHYLLREPRWIQGPEVAALDSLRLRSIALDPFAHRGLEQPLLVRYVHEAAPRDAFLGRSQGISDPEQVRQMARYLEETDPYLRGLLAYSSGELADALRYWSPSLGNREHDWLLAERAGVFVELRQLDSARANLVRALALPHENLHPWETAAAFQCELGRIFEELRDAAAARDAYQSAIAANPRHYAAWMRLGVLALRTGDTASAVAAFERDLEILPADYFAHLTLGAVLSNRGQRDSAIAHLGRATEIEPWAPGGWLLLARARDAAGDTTGAVREFRRFLALAPRNDAARLLAQHRLNQLQPGPSRP